MSIRSTYLNILRQWQFSGNGSESPDSLSRLLRLPRQSASVPQRVGIIGAGVAGLVTAVILERLGHTPIVLEADDRIGGRIFTVRDIFDTPLYAEAGAARVRDDHFWTMALCEELNLQLTPFYPRAVKLIHHCGEEVASRNGEFEASEVHQAITSPVSVDGSNLPGGSVWNQTVGRVAGERWLQVRGGMDRIPRAIAEQLSEPVLTRHVAHKLTHSQQGVDMLVCEAGRRKVIHVDRVICTVPFSVIAEISFEPDLPLTKQTVIDQLTYTSANRIFAQFPRPGGEGKRLPVFGASPRLGEVWQVCHDQLSPHCLVVSYLFGEAARKRALNRAEAVDRAVTEMARIMQVPADQVVRTHWHSWDEQPFARGAQSRVWDLVNVDRSQIREPFGRIQFAGEHTASIRGLGWIDGAIESAVREALRIERQTAVNT